MLKSGVAVAVVSFFLLLTTVCSGNRIGKGIFVYRTDDASASLSRAGFPRGITETLELHIARVVAVELHADWIAIRGSVNAPYTASFIVECRRRGLDVFVYQKLTGLVGTAAAEVEDLFTPDPSQPAVHPDGIIMMPSDCWICDIKDASAYIDAVDDFGWTRIYSPPALRVHAADPQLRSEPTYDRHCSNVNFGLACTDGRRGNNFPHNQFIATSSVIMPRLFWRSANASPHAHRGLLTSSLAAWRQDSKRLVPLGQIDKHTTSHQKITDTFTDAVNTIGLNVQGYGIWILDNMRPGEFTGYSGLTWP